ncbi:pleckstrin homology domain-containing family B member 1 isoform X3 [Microtus ochrogaster]|nr:pleckstrin homology domain-containing family B member 1 isoform X3 [Microtus ochrogaster]XP_026645913.1 pleckstrin homology domain-containing family B member 1 isoform X3 [Microtus ochrogaster]
MALVRSGWLWRQSSILRRWKRNWFALWLDGTLGYYHDETAQDEEDRVLIHFNVRDIKVGQECHDVQPPEGRSRDGLLTVNLREGSRLHLCAETRDDAIAWKTALLEANSTPAPAGATVPPRSRRVCPKDEPPKSPVSSLSCPWTSMAPLSSLDHSCLSRPMVSSQLCSSHFFPTVFTLPPAAAAVNSHLLLILTLSSVAQTLSFFSSLKNCLKGCHLPRASGTQGIVHCHWFLALASFYLASESLYSRLL